ncbi:hypothetical protein JCM11641_005405 [Rhodosporidiobolus odoratus]
MHSHLATHVLALAPDSLASLGELDNDSLSELWAVFTKCKDSLQNGRRLENLTWRLLGRREGKAGACSSDADLTAARAEEIKADAAEAGWSDAEWEETSDEDSEDEPLEPERIGRSPAATSAISPKHASPPPRASQPRARTASVPADPSAVAKEVAQRPPFRRGGSRDWKSAPVLTGGSLQRMITDLQRLPDLSALRSGKARSLHEVSVAPSKPPLGSRGSSAPDNLNAASLSRPATPPSVELIATKIDALTQTSPTRSQRASPVRSPCMSRSASTPSHPTTSASTITVTAPSPAVTASHRRVPSTLTMSAIPASRRSRPPSPSPSPPSPPPVLRLTPTETAMMALSNSRNQSDANLYRRTQSTAELAASFKPASFVKGFNPCPSSLEAHPRPGSIAPPPTPATHPAALALSPKTPAPSPASVVSPSALRTATPAKVAPPRSTGLAPSLSTGRPKPPGTGKKIFFISSPESDEDHSSRSRESGKMRVVITPPSAAKPALKQPASGGNGNGKGKAPVQDVQEATDDDAWGSEDDDQDASSGWGSEYSTDSDLARNSAATGSGRAAAARRPGLDFAKRAPSEVLARTASTASMGQPGELKPRPPGLLSQIFHPEQFLEDSDRPHSTADLLRRNHKSLSALPTLSQLRPSKSAAVLTNPRATHQRSKSYLKGKPEDVELESSSEEEDERPAKKAPSPKLPTPPSQEERSSDYEDMDDDASSSAESAAALLARRQRLAAELEAQSAVLAPPQTPRTTRRAMLATELSESLRRNLLWERQTRNRAMGGAAPRRPQVPGQPLPQRPASSTQLAPPSAPSGVPHVQAGAEGVRAPYPSPATRLSPPNQPSQGPPPRRVASSAALTRRHTTGTGLYLTAQTAGLAQARGADSESDVSETEDEDGTQSPAEVFRGRTVW